MFLDGVSDSLIYSNSCVAFWNTRVCMFLDGLSDERLSENLRRRLPKFLKPPEFKRSRHLITIIIFTKITAIILPSPKSILVKQKIIFKRSIWSVDDIYICMLCGCRVKTHQTLRTERVGVRFQFQLNAYTMIVSFWQNATFMRVGRPTLSNPISKNKELLFQRNQIC